MNRKVSIVASFILLSLVSCGKLPSLVRSEPEQTIDPRLEQIIESSPAAQDDQVQLDKTSGTLLIKITDQNGNNPANIPVIVRGSVEKALLSDEAGQIRFHGPPGNYELAIMAGCTDKVIVEFGGKGSGVVGEGMTTRGALGVRWKHRIAPGNGTYPSTIPFWPIGEVVQIAYDVLDRCNNDKSVASLFPTFAYKTSSNLEVVGPTIMQSDHEGKAHLKVRCLSPGKVALLAYDRANQPDETDLIKYIFFSATQTEEIECKAD